MTRFSQNTIIEIMDVLEFTSHAKIKEFVLRFEVEESDNQESLPKRILGIAEYLIEHPKKKDHGEPI